MPADDWEDLAGPRTPVPIKRKRGNQPYVPTDEVRRKVALWAQVGTTNAVIASELGISEDTLAKYYRVELDEAAPRGVAKVASVLFSKAMAGDVTSAIFYLKTKGRWSEKAAVGDEENPLVIQHTTPQRVADIARALREAKMLSTPTVIEGEATEGKA